MKICVSEIRVKQIRVNQGLGVLVKQKQIRVNQGVGVCKFAQQMRLSHAKIFQRSSVLVFDSCARLCMKCTFNSKQSIMQTSKL